MASCRCSERARDTPSSEEFEVIPNDVSPYAYLATCRTCRQNWILDYEYDWSDNSPNPSFDYKWRAVTDEEFAAAKAHARHVAEEREERSRTKLRERQLDLAKEKAEEEAARTSPVTIDGVVFDENTDFSDLVTRQLEGRGPGPSVFTDILPVDWIYRVVERLRKTRWYEPLTRAIAECLTHKDRSVRFQAAHFFQSEQRAPGSERILELLRSADIRRKMFSGVHGPLGGGATLEEMLLSALAANLTADAREGIEFARAEALRPRLAASVVPGLVWADADWVMENAQRIVEKTPSTRDVILEAAKQMRRDPPPSLTRK